MICQGHIEFISFLNKRQRLKNVQPVIARNNIVFLLKLKPLHRHEILHLYKVILWLSKVYFSFQSFTHIYMSSKKALDIIFDARQRPGLGWFEPANIAIVPASLLLSWATPLRRGITDRSTCPTFPFPTLAA